MALTPSFLSCRYGVTQQRSASSNEFIQGKYPISLYLFLFFLLLSEYHQGSFHAAHFKLSIVANETSRFDVPSPPRREL